MTSHKEYRQTIKLVTYAHVTDLLTGAEKTHDDDDCHDARVGGRTTRTKGGEQPPPATRSAATRSPGSASQSNASAPAEHPIESAVPNCQNEEHNRILDMKMDNGHTLRTYVKQLHYCAWSLATPTVNGISPPNAVRLDFKSINDDELNDSDVASCVKFITPQYTQTGSVSGHFLQELEESKATLTMDLTKESDQRVKEMLESGPLQLNMERLGRPPDIPTNVQKEMDTKAEKTKQIVFVVPNGKIYDKLSDEPNACWMRWALNNEERGCVWHSEMAYSELKRDSFPTLSITEPEIMCGFPRNLELQEGHDQLGITGCMRFVSTTATPAIDEQSEGKKDGNASNVQKRFQGMFIEGAAVPISYDISTTATSNTKFCPDNIAIVLTLEIVTKTELTDITKMSNEKYCPICLDPMKEGQTVKLECNHKLCCDCCDLLLENASKNCSRCIECPLCRTASYPEQCAQFGDAGRQARLQLQIEQKLENKRVSRDFFWWCTKASNRALFKISSHIKCEAIHENVTTLLGSPLVNLGNYETFMHRVYKIFTNWLDEARSNSHKINAKIQECNRSVRNAKDVHSINSAVQQLQELMTDLVQQTQEEAEIVDYITKAKIDMQAIFCGLTCNLQETRTLETLRAWQLASVGTQILPPGWEKFCVSNEELQKYGHILRHKWPKNFRSPEHRPDQKRKSEDCESDGVPESKKQKSHGDASDGENV